MKKPTLEIGSPQSEAGARRTRSVLECGDSSPLFHRWIQSSDESEHSKTWRTVVAVCFLLSAFCFRAVGQSYSIDWHTMDGGGGTSTGGVYTVSGTIGQPDAGRMSGGNYTLHGGFWAIIAAVQTPGAPLLTIFRTTTNTVVVSWPSPSTGWNLEHNTNLNTVNWATPPESVGDNGTEKFIIVNPPTGNRFYRLHKP